MNSKMPLQLEFFCMLKVPYEEIPEQPSKERLAQFKEIQRNDEKTLLQSADLAILLTSSLAENGVGGEVDGVDPTRNPGKFAAAWVSKNYKKAFIHEIGHLFGARHDRRADSRLRSGARFSDTYQHGFFLRDAGNLTQDGQPVTFRCEVQRHLPARVLPQGRREPDPGRPAGKRKLQHLQLHRHGHRGLAGRRRREDPLLLHPHRHGERPGRVRQRPE